MKTIQEALVAHDHIVLDGAFGTEIEKYGCDVNDPLWSAKVLFEDPESVKKVHQSYYEAGANIIESSGYQATIAGFEAKGFSRQEAKDLLAKSVRLAKEARQEFLEAHKENTAPRYVAASVGPYGAFLADGSEYRGDYEASLEDLVAFHKERLAIFAQENPDIFACETVPCLLEAKALVSILEDKDVSRGIPAWISFSCKDDKHISSGETMAEVAQYLDGIDAVAAIGINCTHPSHVEALIKEIRTVTDKAIVVYPNTGELYDPSNKTWHGEGEAFDIYAKSWVAAGATVVGGCCRTAPANIARIASWIHEK
ncbi:MAG: homocysteine S-methyltransferase [Veillonella sp.]|nr:homocysteine S-methyltransferase [Veillonella sp.]